MHRRKWQKLKLNWIAAFELTITTNYGLFWLYIYIHGRFSLFYINFLTGVMICSVSCSTYSKRPKRMKPNGNISTSKEVLYKKLKFSYYNNLFENVFQISGVIGLITLLYARQRCQKSISTLGKSIS